MGFNLTNERIQDTYPQLLQISGSAIVDGTGSVAPVLITSASYAVTASFALNAGDIDTSSLTPLTTFNAYTSSNDSRVDSLTAATSSYLTSLPSGLVSSSAQTIANIAGGTIAPSTINADTANILSASIGYLQSITGSAKIIGDAYIILNNDTPTQRYAGLVVQDSGSTNNTASFEFDGQTNDWFYEYTDDGGATVDHGVTLFGPAYNTRGSHVYPTSNKLQKGTGGHHLADSSITDDGSTVSFSAELNVTGGVTASAGFKGDLDGTASFATTASYAVSADTASMSSGNFEVQGQLYSPTFAGSVASSTSSVDFDNGNFVTLNLTAATFLANPSNLKSGTTYTIIIDSGSLITNHGSAWKFAGGTSPTYSDGTDVLTCVSDGTNLYATALTDFQ